jgi:hypothetical protein
MGGLSYGAVKDQLATVVANGVGSSAPRVLMRTNEATKLILDEMIPVNGMATYDVVATLDSGNQVLLLPKELENAIEVQVLSGATVNGQTDVTQGWNLVTNFTYVDPSNAHDNPLIDQGLVPDGIDPTILRRKYIYPGLQSGATVRVTGAKRYVPITGDGDYLIVQNIRALKLAILSIERDENSAQAEGDGYLQKALRVLQAEVKKHQLDPTNSLKRKANYQSDLLTYDEGTLGRTRARLALEVSGMLNVGKSEITYLINRAVQMLVDNRNQLAIAGRISVHGTTTEIVYAPTNAPATVLPITDYNQIRLLVQSFIAADAAPNPQNPAGQVDAALAQQMQQQAFELQKAQLIEATELARHTTYTTALGVYLPGSFGYVVARLALEMEGGLQLTTTELERVLSMAEMRLMEQGIWKGCLREVNATITGGEVLFPRDIETVLAADICGQPTDIRSIFFEYQQNGPGKTSFCSCSRMFVDRGEVYFPQTGFKRRKYFYNGSSTRETQFTAVCKIRYVPKVLGDELVIKNFEALRLMSQAIMMERQEKWNDAVEAQQLAVQVLQKELEEYLGGIQHIIHVEMRGYGMGDIGDCM